MTCQTCGDKGLVKLWADSTEVAVCLCAAARWYRSDVNAGKHTGIYGWQVWCARNQIEPSRLYLLEEVLTPTELAAAGFQDSPKEALASREAALLATGKGKARVRL